MRKVQYMSIYVGGDRIKREQWCDGGVEESDQKDLKEIALSEKYGTEDS